MAAVPPEEKVDVGRVLGRGFGAVGANFLPFLAISLVVVGAPIFVSQYWATNGGELLIARTSDWRWTLGGLLIGLVASVLLQSVLVRATVLHLSGRDPDPWTSARLALQLLPALVGLSVVLGLLVGIGVLLLVVPGVMIYCATAVAVPAMIEERGGIAASIDRSRDLTRGSRWHVFLIFVLYWIVGAVIQGVAGQFTGVTLFGAAERTAADRAIAAAAEAASASLSTMIFAVVVAALYVELREVKEGASVNELAEVFE